MHTVNLTILFISNTIPLLKQKQKQTKRPTETMQNGWPTYTKLALHINTTFTLYALSGSLLAADTATFVSSWKNSVT